MIENMPKSGTEARKLGAQKYFTGAACIRGHVSTRYAHNGVCTGCSSESSKRHTGTPEREAYQRQYYVRQRSKHPERIMLTSAKHRAKVTGGVCTITADDVRAAFPVDGLCPVLGIKLENNFDGETGNHKGNSPSLDKIIPELGYVRGNIAVISMHANRLKGDETDPEVFRKLANWIERMKK